MAEKTKEVLDAVEEVVETIDKATPPNLNLNGTTKGQQVAILVATAVLGAVAGGSLTYLVAKKKLRTKYEEISKQEIEEAKKFYAAINKTGEFSTPESAMDALGVKGEKPKDDDDEIIREFDDPAEALRYYAGQVEVPKATEAELIDEEVAAKLETIEGRVVEVESVKRVRKNVFQEAHTDDTWDFEEEERHRTPGKPYILHHDEFYVGENDYEQMTLTYYEGDDVLADSSDKPIEDTEGLVGNMNLTRFGYGSKDKNVVYIRNERLELDIEVVRSGGEYAKEVLGFIEHSDRRGRGGRGGIRKFRDDDG